MIDLDTSLTCDRETIRVCNINLEKVGKVREIKKRPANRRRQRIFRFNERECSVESS